MSWKCACKHENEDTSFKCGNCGRNKPQYLGIKLDITTEKLNTEQMAVWYLMVSHGFYQEADSKLKEFEDLKSKKGNQNFIQSAINEELSKLQDKIFFYTSKCFTLLEKSLKLSPDAQIKDVNGAIQDAASIKSNCYFCLGGLYFNNANYADAIKNYQLSYDADPNQVSIYNIAMATINLPTDRAGLFAGKKNEQAEENKKKQEIDLLLKTIHYAPFSSFGVECGKMLLTRYGLIVTSEDF